MQQSVFFPILPELLLRQAKSQVFQFRTKVLSKCNGREHVVGVRAAASQRTESEAFSGVGKHLEIILNWKSNHRFTLLMCPC